MNVLVSTCITLFAQSILQSYTSESLRPSIHMYSVTRYTNTVNIIITITNPPNLSRQQPNLVGYHHRGASSSHSQCRLRDSAPRFHAAASQQGPWVRRVKRNDSASFAQPHKDKSKMTTDPVHQPHFIIAAACLIQRRLSASLSRQ